MGNKLENIFGYKNNTYYITYINSIYFVYVSYCRMWIVRDCYS